jgi:hypothetical protein
MGGWVDGWMCGSKSRFKNFLQQSKNFFLGYFACPMMRNLADSGLKKICCKKITKLILQNTLHCITSSI